MAALTGSFRLVVSFLWIARSDSNMLSQLAEQSHRLGAEGPSFLGASPDNACSLGFVSGTSRSPRVGRASELQQEWEDCPRRVWPLHLCLGSDAQSIIQGQRSLKVKAKPTDTIWRCGKTCEAGVRKIGFGAWL